MKEKLLLALLILLFCSHSIFSQSYTLAGDSQKTTIMSNINKVAAKTNTLECTFVQEKTVSILSETITSEGMMYFKKENKLRWQYNKPYSYIFILAGGKVIIKNEARVDSFDANSNKMFKTISEIMIGGVKGDLFNDNKNFTSKIYVGTNDVLVKLTPLNKEIKQLMSVINLTISKTDWMVESIEMKETSGDNTIIRFTKKNVNKPISETLFSIN